MSASGTDRVKPRTVDCNLLPWQEQFTLPPPPAERWRTHPALSEAARMSWDIPRRRRSLADAGPIIGDMSQDDGGNVKRTIDRRKMLAVRRSVLAIGVVLSLTGCSGFPTSDPDGDVTPAVSSAATSSETPSRARMFPTAEPSLTAEERRKREEDLARKRAAIADNNALEKYGAEGLGYARWSRYVYYKYIAPEEQAVACRTSWCAQYTVVAVFGCDTLYGEANILNESDSIIGSVSAELRDLQREGTGVLEFDLAPFIPAQGEARVSVDFTELLCDGQDAW